MSVWGERQTRERETKMSKWEVVSLVAFVSQAVASVLYLVSLICG